MNKIELYIAGQKVDLSDSSFVLLNYTHDDLSNPTILKNSFSQQITIPGTANNNRLFGAIWRFDRQTIAGGGAGVNFDAAKKTPFLLFDGAACLESGYIKLDSISKKGDAIAYKVSLYGGLGSFFYSLTYDSDGNKRNLASLSFANVTDVDGSQIETPFTINRSKVQELWEDVDLNALSFAPCYNGIPADFDAAKCIAGPFLKTDPSGSVELGYPLFLYYPRSVTQAGDDGDITFRPYDKRWTVITFNKQLTEWQISDLRSWMQRPVVRMKAIIDAMCQPENNGGYTVTLDSAFFNETNPYYYKTWLTLPLLSENVKDGSTIRSGSTITKAMLLGATASPADYLISFCKMFGLSVIVNNATMTAEILRRETLFGNSDIIDINSRVDRSQEININPYPYSSKWYAMRNEVAGAFADNYKATTGRTYGEQRINTGYDFDVAERPLLDGLAFRGAVEVLESDPLFSKISYADGQDTSVMPSAVVEGGTFTFYAADGTTTDVDLTRPGDAVLSPINAAYPFSDIFAKPQLHAADNKAIDGANVLLFFRGREDVSAADGLHLSDDPTDLLTALNDGKPCWLFPFILNGENLAADYCDIVTSMPSFGRYIYDGDTITHALDFGNPSELAMPGKTIATGAPLYARYWQRYIADRFDNDSKVVTLWLDLRGLPQGNDLLRRFVYMGGAIWTINKIINQAINKDSLTQVELVKVQSLENFR